MKHLPALVAMAAAWLGISATSAWGQRAVPSCYAAAKLPVAPPRPARSVFVFVDQTAPLDQDLRRTVRTGMEELLVSGTSFTIATFSSLSPSHHTKVLSSGTIEGAVPGASRPALPVNKLSALDRCLLRQKHYAVRVATQALVTATRAQTSTFSRSEILGSLTHLSHAVRTAPAREKVVIVASDLLEHSSASSFYNKRDLRTINPRVEMQKATKLGLVGDFGRARVYVVGTAALPPGAGASERSIGGTHALVAFWTQWFHRSNSSLVIIGRPDLVAPIR